MNKYIDSEKLIAEIERLKEGTPIGICEYDKGEENGRMEVLTSLRSTITSLQLEQPKDKQIIIITESHGDANIEWDCRSLDDVIALLKSAESFITEKQVEELRGHGSEPDYNTTEGRFRNAHKFQQDQPEVDLEKFTEKVKTFQARYKHSESISVKGAMAFMARMFYRYPNVARQWYDSLPKATMD